ncbi:LOW QUALITY PROTEIN: hypothetical protein CVT25_004951, partial [Psilocybe cyanescens]
AHELHAPAAPSSLLRITTSINPTLFSDEPEFLFRSKSFGEAFEFLFDKNRERNTGLIRIHCASINYARTSCSCVAPIFGCLYIAIWKFWRILRKYNGHLLFSSLHTRFEIESFFRPTLLAQQELEY